jgi:hypothetical protein
MTAAMQPSCQADLRANKLSDCSRTPFFSISTETAARWSLSRIALLICEYPFASSTAVPEDLFFWYVDLSVATSDAF